MKFSIIVNNYNYGAYLAEAIESALAQTYHNKEIIVVDDGSTDNSRDIIQKYPVISVLKENGGQASAFNAGFKKSTGELILFLDSDDRLHPTALEEVVAAYRPHFSRLQFDLEIVDQHGKSLGQSYSQIFMKGTLPSGDHRRAVSRYQLLCIPTSGNVFSRKALEVVMPLDEPEWRICADTPLLVLTAFYGPVQSLMRVLGDYRCHANNGWFRSGSITPKEYFKQMELRQKTQNCLLKNRERIGREVIFPGDDQGYWKSMLAYAIAEAPEKKKEAIRGGMQSAWKHTPTGIMDKLVCACWYPCVAYLPREWALNILKLHLPIGKPHIHPGELEEAKEPYVKMS